MQTLKSIIIVHFIRPPPEIMITKLQIFQVNNSSSRDQITFEEWKWISLLREMIIGGGNHDVNDAEKAERTLVPLKFKVSPFEAGKELFVLI